MVELKPSYTPLEVVAMLLKVSDAAIKARAEYGENLTEGLSLMAASGQITILESISIIRNSSNATKFMELAVVEQAREIGFELCPELKQGNGDD